MKHALIDTLRAIHLLAAPVELPDRIAIYFHALERAQHTRFAEAISHLLSRGYRTVTPAQYVRSEGPVRRLFVSFDDNFRSWHTALDLFARLGITVTFYTNSHPFRDTATPGEIASYFDRIAHTGEPMTLSTRELRDIHAAGHTIGCHTHTHPRLSDLDRANWAGEIDRSKRVLEDLIGAEICDFSYPFGMRRHFSRALRAHCAAVGFRTIATGIGGLQHQSPIDPLCIHRSGWKLDAPTEHNIEDLRINASVYARLTGRSATG